MKKGLVSFLFGVMLIMPLTTAQTTTATDKIIKGTITKIKTSAPYPFTTVDGRVWMCKIKIYYYEQEETGEWEWAMYKAYPLKGTQYENACRTFRVGDLVEAMVRSKASDYRGDIIWIEKR